MDAEALISAYIEELRGRLECSRLRRRRILTEVRAHLRDTVDADVTQTDGDSAAAARRAIARFGTVEQTVGAFRDARSGPSHGERARLAAAVVLGAGVVALVLALTGQGGSHGSGAMNGTRGPLQAGAPGAPGAVHYRLAAAPGCVPLPVRSPRRRVGLGHSSLACGTLSPEVPRRVLAGICSGRLGIHIGAASARARTVRIVLADGVVAGVLPVSRLLGQGSEAADGLLLFASSPAEQLLRVQTLAADGRVLASVSGKTLPLHFPAIAAMLPPQMVVSAALTRHGPVVISLRRGNASKDACGRCPAAGGGSGATESQTHHRRGCASSARRASAPA
ncbi:MAG: permease prefix domain 1-containing protein [Solirubrobacteraceae bacterium]